MSIIDIVLSYLPKKRKTPKGWYKFNAICCSHNGESADLRERGGIILTGDSISYHCFNCGFKATYTPGHSLSNKFRKLLDYLNIPGDVKLVINREALALKEFTDAPVRFTAKTKPVVFADKLLPNNSVRLTQNPLSALEQNAVKYIESRGLDIELCEFYVSSNLPDRVIIPYYYNNRLVGYIGRKMTPGSPKYFGDEQPGFVFNVDSLSDESTFALVSEGPFDALSIDGLAILGSDITSEQISIISRIHKTIIVVPDRDANGRKTIDKIFEINETLANPWKISLPDWDISVKDANDAVLKYGKLYTIYSILRGVISDKFTAEVKAKFWFTKEELKKYDYTTKH